MATRSRFKDFARLRVEHFGRAAVRPTSSTLHEDHEDDGHGNLMKNGHEAAVEMRPVSSIPGLPPRWADIISDVKDIEKEIEAKYVTLTELQRKNLGVQFSMGSNEEEDEQRIRIQTSHIAKLFKEMETLILLLDKELKENKKEGEENTRRMVENMKTGLVLTANSLSRKFREGQRQYLNRLTKQKEKKGRFQTVTGGGKQQMKDLDREEVIEKYLEKGLTPDQVEMMIVNERSTNERDAELKAILASIVDLHSMFQDMNTLIIEQGTVLDRVDYNLNLTREKIVAGVKEVEKAKGYQDQSKFKLCFLLIFILFIAFGIALEVKFSSN